ncbi:MAG: ribonuclease protein component [Halanaerobiales bacterium]|nr:ribonuclease protein component [Halanaerobiales bacterium]
MDSLKKNRDFKRVYSRGRSCANHNLVLYYFPNNLDKNRVGFSISKKIGKAVVRNKLRRRLREIIRLKNNLKEGYDLIFIARKPVVKLDYHDLEKNVINLLKKAGIWQ